MRRKDMYYLDAILFSQEIKFNFISKKKTWRCKKMRKKENRMKRKSAANIRALILSLCHSNQLKFKKSQISSQIPKKLEFLCRFQDRYVTPWTYFFHSRNAEAGNCLDFREPKTGHFQGNTNCKRVFSGFFSATSQNKGEGISVRVTSNLTYLLTWFTPSFFSVVLTALIFFRTLTKVADRTFVASTRVHWNCYFISYCSKPKM